MSNIDIFNGIKKSFTEDNLTKAFIIITIVAVIISMSNNVNRGSNIITAEGFENYNCRDCNQSNTFDNSIDNTFDKEYIQLYENVIKDTNRDTRTIEYIIGKTNIDMRGLVVNIGCKTGSINKYLKHHYNIDSIGLDRSPEMIDYCLKQQDGNLNGVNYDILDIATLDSIAFGYNKPVSHIISLNREIYYYDNIGLFFEQCYRLLEIGGYLIIDLIDHDRFNTTSVYSRINHFNPNNLSIKRINDSVLRFNDIVYNTRYRMYPNNNEKYLKNSNLGKAWLTETVTNPKTNGVREYIHSLNVITRQEIEEIANKYDFDLINMVNLSKDLGLEYYNDEYLYIFQKR